MQVPFFASPQAEKHWLRGEEMLVISKQFRLYSLSLNALIRCLNSLKRQFLEKLVTYYTTSMFLSK